MQKKSNKIDKILDEATLLLQSHGDFSVTMRKVASLCDMSLSNLQYYFKNKDELLKAMADKYFQQCLNGLQESPTVESEDDLKAFITAQFSAVMEVSDMCRIFREYWAISSRNAQIESYLKRYYTNVVDILGDKLNPIAKDKECLSAAIALLISLIEGYSVTAHSMPVNHDGMVVLTHKTTLSILQGS
ncbi:MAG: TetR/AcrR family transcriptional regulator [Alteromonadaceae bacterium]|nr:TetR/AcrR family transcriptional regulator [Alteromonadaceae bacterium]